MKAKKIIISLIGALLLLVFLSLMVTYQVSSTQIVLVTPWSGPPAIKYGSVDMMSEEVRSDREAKGLPENDTGIQFRLPWPLQKVYHLDGRVHVMETGFGEESGAGDETVQVAIFAGWNVNDAEKFRQKFGRFRSAEAMMGEAEVQLAEVLRVARSHALGTAKLMDFFDDEGEGASVYDVAEKKILESARTEAKKLGLGIRFLGIKRVGVPGDLAQGIISGMAKSKQKEIERLDKEANRDIKNIIAEADLKAKQLRDDAENNATRMRNEALSRIEPVYANADKTPEMAQVAIQLKAIKALKSLQGGKNTRLFISENHPLFQFLSGSVTNMAPKR